MAQHILITGGSRSGKSYYAQKMAEALEGKKIFLATCPKGIDAEMDQRILRHQNDRDTNNWTTIEIETDLNKVSSYIDEASVVLIDCLTLWVNNMLFHFEKGIHEDRIEKELLDFRKNVQKVNCKFIWVSNEIGMGIIPDNQASRKYRDLVGRANQTVASFSEEVYLLVSGCPLQVKG